MSDAEIERARQRTVRARSDLTEALQALKARLMPRTIAHNLIDGAKDKAADAAEAGVEVVKARPGVAIGAVALAGLFLSRKSISRAISGPSEETPPAKARSPRRSTRQPVRKAKP